MSRLDGISSFIVMDILEAAQELQAAGHDVVHLEVGQPDFNTPDVIVEAAHKALRAGATRYTHSLGKISLREAICAYYEKRYGVQVNPGQVLVASGTSPAMLLTFAALCEPGEEVLLSNPHYACYPNFLRLLDLRAVYFPLFEAEGFTYDTERMRASISPRTRAVLVNSPSNPTGAVLPAETLAAIAELGPTVVSDEIYHGLTYGDVQEHTILEFTDRAFVLDGFSKRYAMTGWRLGWVVAPPEYVPAMQRLQQNLFISAADFAQDAGIAALEHAAPHAEQMRQQYDLRRQRMVPLARDAGLRVTHDPQGAFYVLADASRFGRDSLALAQRILREAKVGVAPGIDFGPGAEGCLRFSYACALERIEEGMRRLAAWASHRAPVAD